MTLTNESWLYKNNTRRYPFADESTAITNGLVDIHVAFPESLAAPGARVYVDQLIVSPNVAIVGVSLEGYLNAQGTARIAEVVVQTPTAYRLYPLSTGSSDISGFVIFGSAAHAETEAVSQTLTVTTGVLLESVLLRYPLGVAAGFLVGTEFVSGDVLFTGELGITAEVVSVWFEDAGETKPAMVLRLDRNVTAMLSPVAICDMPTEAGTRKDLCTSINGVLPDSNGTIFLEFWTKFDFQYEPSP